MITSALRRSPLAHRHRALGARFAATGEWPAAYGEPAREGRALRERAALVDLGPFDKLAIAGAPRLAAPAPAHRTGCVEEGAVAGRRAVRWGLNADESLLVLPAAEAGAAATLVARLVEEGITATDTSSKYAMFGIGGPAARAILAELFPEDLSAAALANDGVVLGPLARVAVALARRDRDDLPAFEALVERDLAEYVWDALVAAGAGHGLELVGGDVWGPA